MATLSGRGRRTKGLRFENTVRKLIEQVGGHARGLERGGDHLAVMPSGEVWHVECKHQEVWEVPRWIRQAELEAPPGKPVLLAIKRNGVKPYAVLDLEVALRMMGRP